MSKPSAIEPTPQAALMQLINGFQVSQAIYVAATLGIADLLVSGSRSSEDLAAATSTHPRFLYRLLRALAAVGVLHEAADQRFSLTPMGDCLRSDAPEPAAPWAAFIGREYYWSAWGSLLHSIRSGDNAFRHVHDTDVWRYRAENPEEGAIFDRAMTGNSRMLIDAILAAVDFSPFGCIVDVAGGQGVVLARILAVHQRVRGILFDQPHVVINAVDLLRDAGVADRCGVVGGDFFQAIPEGGDAYLLKRVLHDWDDASAIDILRACRRAAGARSKLLVIESIIGPPNEGPIAKFQDLNMLVSPGGQERTPEEFAALFAAADFQLTAVTPTEGRVSVIEGIPV